MITPPTTTHYKPSAERFAKDTEAHTMAVIRDGEVYRHLQFKRPDTIGYYFDLITWPGHLVVSGDMGTYVFSRTLDMFEFFGGDRDINPGYWAEKLKAPSPHDVTEPAAAYFEDGEPQRRIHDGDDYPFPTDEYDFRYLWNCWAVWCGVAEYRRAKVAQSA